MRFQLRLAVIAAAAIAIPANAQAAAPSGVLPSDLSVWGMFAAADWVVKAVMIGLLFASIITWTVLVAKHLELARARKGAETLRDALAGASSLASLPKDMADQPLLTEARQEIALSAAALDDREGLKERLISRTDRHEAKLARQMTQGVTILGTIGATAPFVGLFGTVWGIMNSFIGIAEEQTTNLAVVAPGIAEALLATALGLVAAIPAVVIYNHFARQIAAHRAIVADSAAALLRLVSRDLSRGTLAA
jgi:biopolymer transport protein ExbB